MGIYTYWEGYRIGVTFTGTSTQTATLTIFDLTGRLMHIYPLTGNETTIPVADLPQGMYVCRINAGDGLIAT